MRILLLLPLLASCVTKGRFEVSQIQLDATRAALSTRDAEARRAAEAARGREDALEGRIGELETSLQVQQVHQDELTAEVERLTSALAEHTLRGQTECPPLPEPPPPPEGEPPPDPVEEAPDVTERRLHVAASLETVRDALDARARARLIAAERNTLHTQVEDAFQSLTDDELAFIDPREEGTVVRFLVAKLYNENQTTLSPLGIELVDRMAVALRQLPAHRLVVVGHTDDRAVHSLVHPSNWELAFAYAAGVVRSLKDAAIPMEMSAESRAGEDPLVPPIDAEARRLNRRVELLLIPKTIELPEPEPSAPAPDEPSPDRGPSEDPELQD